MNAPPVYKSRLIRILEEGYAPDVRPDDYTGRVSCAPRVGKIGPSGASLGAWMKSGRQSFYVSPTLAEALDDTDLRGAPTDLIRPPYPAFFIETERSPWPLEAGERFLGVLVVYEEPPASEHKQLWAFVLVDNLGQSAAIGTYELCFYLDKPNVSDCIHDALSEMRFRDLANMQRSACEDEKIVSPGMTYAAKQSFDALTERIMCFVVNLILYLSGPDPDIRKSVPPQVARGSGKKHAEFAQRFHERNGTTWATGYDVTYVREVNGEAEEAGGVHRSVRKHLVRGHWKAQAYGPGLSHRRSLWIFPYWRGSRDPIQCARTYVCREKSEA